MKTAKKRRPNARAARAQRDAENLAAGGRHRIDISTREPADPARLNTALSRVTEAVNAQLHTPEAWAAVWRDPKPDVLVPVSPEVATAHAITSTQVTEALRAGADERRAAERRTPRYQRRLP